MRERQRARFRALGQPSPEERRPKGPVEGPRRARPKSSFVDRHPGCPFALSLQRSRAPREVVNHVVPIHGPAAPRL